MAKAKAATKSEIFKRIADETGLTRKQVASVFDALTGAIKSELGKKGPGVFGLPGLAKMVVKVKPAVPAGEYVNPFTKQKEMRKAKPASRVVRIRPLKALKELVK